MMNSMKENLENWFKDMKLAREITLTPGKPVPTFKIPDFHPKFLGFILNRFNSNSIGEIINGI